MAHGKICYLEIPARTGEESAAFYGKIFGWNVRRRGDGEMAFDDPGGVSGTWVKESDQMADETTRIYIVTPRKEIGPGMGAFAVFADPAGTEFGLYEEPAR